MTKTKFKIGDRVKIKWPGDRSHGKIGTIVKYHGYFWCTIKIPGFDGHDGDIKDGTKDKRYVSEKYLIKLSSEMQSMKIEVKQTAKKTENLKKIVYPCFKKSNNGNGLVVLFFSETSGVVVDRGNSPSYHIEQFLETWTPSTFFKIPLENYSASISSNP